MQSYGPRVEQYAQLIAHRNPAPVPLVVLSRRIVPPTGLAARISARVRLHYRAARVPLIGRLSKLTANCRHPKKKSGSVGHGEPARLIMIRSATYIAYPFQRYAVIHWLADFLR